MRRRIVRSLGLVFGAVLLVAVYVGTASADTRTIGSGGTTQIAPRPFGGTEGPFTREFPKMEREDGTPFVNRGHRGKKKLFPKQALDAPNVTTSTVAALGTEFKTSFTGLNFRDQRRANSGNQFSVEPPDQALCVGGDFVLESVNTVLRVYNKAGTALTEVQDLNSFYGYAAQFNRSTGAQGPFLTDPVCYFDPEMQRFVHVVLTLDVVPSTGDFTGTNHLDIAVSNTASPLGTWTIYRIPVQDDGTAGTPNHHCKPGPGSELATNPRACIGDYPHIGADANGVYITTNEYSFFGPGYNGAQIYALPKSELYTGGPSLDVTQIENASINKSPGFTLAPATSNPGGYEKAAGGTEYFLSTLAGDGSETGNPTGTANKIVLWALSNTSSLNTDKKKPKLKLDATALNSETYVLPPLTNQKTGDFPLGQCINDTTTVTFNGTGCWRLLFCPALPTPCPAGAQPAHNEIESSPDSGDTRQFQVWFANGKLYGAAGTGMNVGGSGEAGIAWWQVTPSVNKDGTPAGSITKQGYVGLTGNNLTYPAIAVRPDGKGTIAFTVGGDTFYPSAGYATFDANATNPVGPIRIAAAGLGPDDGFTGYKAFVGDPPRTRWGDYGAAVTDGSDIWIASEWIGQTCNLATYIASFSPDAFAGADCGGTRDTLGNWNTRITRVNP
jgi:hypothetical protein